jgi:hypothetical protein
MNPAVVMVVMHLVVVEVMHLVVVEEVTEVVVLVYLILLHSLPLLLQLLPHLGLGQQMRR